MPTFRPAVNENDGYIQKLIKYIPAEIVMGYTVLIGYLKSGNGNEQPTYYTSYFLILFVALAIITPIWTFYAVFDNAEGDPVENKKRAYFHACIATFSYIIWVYAIDNPFLKVMLCSCESSTCENCAFYNPVLGSIILVLFTIITPLLERIVLNTKLPNK